MNLWRTLRLHILLIGFIALSGCVGFPRIWHPTLGPNAPPLEGHITLVGSGMEFDIPKGWVSMGGDDTGIGVEKYGSKMLLGAYDTSREDHGPPTGPLIKNLPGLSPEQASANLMQELGSRVKALHILMTTSAVVGGKPGFRTTYTYFDSRYNPMKGCYYGLMLGTWHYHLIFEADEDFFEKDLPTFEGVKASFRLIAPKGERR